MREANNILMLLSEMVNRYKWSVSRIDPFELEQQPYIHQQRTNATPGAHRKSEKLSDLTRTICLVFLAPSVEVSISVLIVTKPEWNVESRK